MDLDDEIKFVKLAEFEEGNEFETVPLKLFELLVETVKVLLTLFEFEFEFELLPLFEFELLLDPVTELLTVLEFESVLEVEHEVGKSLLS